MADLKEKYKDKPGYTKGANKYDGDQKAADKDATIEEQLTAIYQEHKPEKVDSVPDLLKKYAGAEQKLLDSVKAKYGIEDKEEVTLEPTAALSTFVITTRPFACHLAFPPLL